MLTRLLPSLVIGHWSFVIATALTLALLTPYPSARAAAAPQRPNILVVLLDDVGYGDFGCHGHPFVQTPHIDRLHGESVRLTNFHVASMRWPTRDQLKAQLMEAPTR